MGERDFRYNNAERPPSTSIDDSVVFHLIIDSSPRTPNIHYVLPTEIMLQENSNHVERTIDAIFLMSGGGDNKSATGSLRWW